MATNVRKQAPRLARPAGRYWKGKAPKGAADLPSSSDESEEERPAPQEEGDIAFAGEQEFLHAEHDQGDEEEQNQGHVTGKMSLALKNVNISKEGKVTIAGKTEVGRTEMEGAPPSLDHYQHCCIFDNYTEELSEETEEETDAKAADQVESDEVCHLNIGTSLSLI
jgi:microfibrillar-associated protein 1